MTSRLRRLLPKTTASRGRNHWQGGLRWRAKHRDLELLSDAFGRYMRSWFAAHVPSTADAGMARDSFPSPLSRVSCFDLHGRYRIH
jgi:hypothetical protein